MRRIHLTILTLVLAALVAAPALAAPAAVETPVAQTACDLPTPAVSTVDTGVPAADPIFQATASEASLPSDHPSWGMPNICDPNRQCTTDAQCGQFGFCAVWRLCICTG